MAVSEMGYGGWSLPVWLAGPAYTVARMGLPNDAGFILATCGGECLLNVPYSGKAICGRSGVSPFLTKAATSRRMAFRHGQGSL